MRRLALSGGAWLAVACGEDPLSADSARAADASVDAAVAPATVCGPYCEAFERACGGPTADVCVADCETRAGRARNACATAFERYFGCLAVTAEAFECLSDGLARPVLCRSEGEAWADCL
jgi:Tfp pilus assembly protein PilX